jgi:hypothetical protein
VIVRQKMMPRQIKKTNPIVMVPESTMAKCPTGSKNDPNGAAPKAAYNNLQ